MDMHAHRLKEQILPFLNLRRCLRTIEEPLGKAAVVWMLGEYGQDIPDAPYLLETVIGDCKQQDATSEHTHA